ncbi:phosphotriesterase-related protein [Devosia sp. UYZn731]|uniref:phosphotriesterase family protein n=1 Tax=Devosia sp. UYZn731 TaxID=3156345 RepID=UPI0033925E57
MKHLITTLGPYRKDQLGMILPHEHVFVDLRTPDQPGYAQAEAADVVALMAPQIFAIQKQGITALVECTTGGVGRRADLDKAVSVATGLPIVVPTGNYREPWIPDWVGKASGAELEDWMVGELTGQIEDSGVMAAWIKVSAGDDGITPLEERILRAAARAGMQTNAVIGSHTIRGRVVMDQLDIIEDEGYRAERFISIHTQAEPDFELHKAVAARGAWIEYDHVGREPDDEVCALILKALDAGLGPQLLLSHDLGWFDPALPGGGTPRPYTHLVDVMLPMLRAAGVSEETIVRLTQDNPFEAFAR